MSKLTLALGSAGVILVYLGLPIAGWGGFDALLANPARALTAPPPPAYTLQMTTNLLQKGWYFTLLK